MTTTQELVEHAKSWALPLDMGVPQKPPYLTSFLRDGNRAYPRPYFETLLSDDWKEESYQESILPFPSSVTAFPSAVLGMCNSPHLTFGSQNGANKNCSRVSPCARHCTCIWLTITLYGAHCFLLQTRKTELSGPTYRLHS